MVKITLYWSVPLSPGVSAVSSPGSCHSSLSSHLTLQPGYTVSYQSGGNSSRPSSENHPYFMELKETYKTINRHGSAHGWHEDISGRRRCWQSGWRRRRLQSRTNKLCRRKLWRCSSFLVAQYSSRLLTCLSKLESIRFIEGSSSLQVLRVDLIGPRRRGTTFSQYHNVSHVVDASS